MMSEANEVTLVLDPDFGERLKILASHSHVWTIDTPDNHTIAEEYWREHPGYKMETGITTFQKYEEETLDQTCLRLLDTIDAHHGEYASNPPYSVIEIIGLAISEEILSVLEGQGFEPYGTTNRGDRFIRKQK